MFRTRLHPTPSGFALGIAMIALWALLWVWFLVQLAGTSPSTTAARAASDAAEWTAAATGVRGATA